MPYWRAERGSKLAQLRVLGHSLLDSRIERMGRSAAYKWLAREMQMPLVDCHFGHMSESQCERAISVLKREEEERCPITSREPGSPR